MQRTLSIKEMAWPLGGSLWWRIVGIGLLLAIWTLLTEFAVVGRGFIPSVSAVTNQVLSLVSEGDTLRHVGVTLRRIAIATVVAGALGISLGVMMGLSRRAEAFFLPVVLLGLAVPGLIYVIMALLILGISETSTMLSLIAAVTPFIANIAYEGVGARNQALDEMAAFYRFGRRRWIEHVVMPQVAPAVLTALRTAFALSWKLVVLMEALSASTGVGAAIFDNFRLLRSAVVLAYVVIFVTIMMAIEAAIFGPLEKRLLRWRPGGSATVQGGKGLGGAPREQLHDA